MSTLKVIIVDDEPLAINVLKKYVSEMKELVLEKTFSNAVEASSYLRDHEVDVIFLDINMPVLDGLSFLKSLQGKPMVVITTAHEEFALKSFELEAIDYLVKPVPFPRFLKSMHRIIDLKKGNQKQDTMATQERPSLFVKVDKKKLQKIYIDEIVVIESLKDYVRIKTTSGKYIIHKTLTSFTEELPAEKFIRIHRSYTIALDKIDVVEGNSIEIDGIRYIIGRSYLNEAKERIFSNQISF